jgi:hypothetical protein
MKLCALSPDMIAQIAALLDHAKPEQLWLEAPALAQLRSTLDGAGFVPMIYVGVDGGLVQGATGNCEMRMISADYDLDGTDVADQRFLRVFQSTAVPIEHQVLSDADVCNALFDDALAPENVAPEAGPEGMKQ